MYQYRKGCYQINVQGHIFLEYIFLYSVLTEIYQGCNYYQGKNYHILFQLKSTQNIFGISTRDQRMSFLSSILG